MDTDSIKEKYIRNEEALTRLREDVSQLILSRIQDFKGTKDYLDTLIKEKEAVDVQLVEQKAKIASLKDGIESNKNMISSTRQRNSENLEDISKKEILLRDLEREQESTILSSEALQKENQKIKLDIDNRKIAIAEYQKKINDLKRKLLDETESKDREREILAQSIKEIQDQNSIVTFLLEESAEDIPEVEILAELMRQERATMEQLKKSLDGRISPVIITRTVGRMIEKGLINHNEHNDTLTPK